MVHASSVLFNSQSSITLAQTLDLLKNDSLCLETQPQ